MTCHARPSFTGTLLIVLFACDGWEAWRFWRYVGPGEWYELL